MRVSINLFFFVFFWQLGLAQQVPVSVDSLKRVLRQANNDQARMEVYKQLGHYYVFSYLDSSIHYLSEALELAQSKSDRNSELYCANWLSLALTLSGDYSNGLKFGFRALNLATTLKDTVAIANANMQLMTSYREQEDYGEALKYGYAAIRILKNYHGESNKNYVLGIMSSVFEKNNQLDSALLYARKSYALNPEWSGLLQTFGDVYTKMGKPDLALTYYRRGLPIAARTRIHIDFVDIYNDMSKIFETSGQMDSSIYYAHQSISQLGSKTYPEGVLRASLQLTRLYEIKGNQDSIIKYQKLTIALKDNLFNRAKTREAQSLAFNEKFRQQEADIQQQKRNNTIRLWAMFIALTFIGMIAFFLYRNNLQKKKVNALLQSKNRTLEIEAALERVRSRTMAMQKSIELTEVARVLFQQLEALDIKVWTTGFNVWSDDNNFYTDYITSPQGAFIEPYTIDASVYEVFRKVSDAKKRGDEFFVHYEEGAMLEETYRQLSNFNSKEQYEIMLGDGAGFPKQQYEHFVFGKKVSLMFITYEPVPEAYDIFKRFGKVFDQTYTRFLDLQKKEEQAANLAQEKQKLEQTLSDLRATQAQLIQTEKLASLGELTAGIAHEIQNPLNFVNNFAEVSAEMIGEMEEELDKGDTSEAKAIAADLKTNLEKINHHGQRASSIVKGMLEHSRASTGVKEPTDLNALADEYLRLAYHGLRAKDSNFNAKLETHFDPDLPKVSVIPQDIGRVLLNLINNAFYATNEKANKKIEGYQATVTLSTKRLEHAIEISVQDNGNGIPEAIKDKIFQPFFTTKPTGQGTGLGLSLAYDIVTKGHGGTLEVDSTEGSGTVFTLSLTLN